MNSPARIWLFAAIVLTGCGTARDVAVTSFRVIDAPAHFVRRKIDSPNQTTTTTTTVTSDVTNPGQPVEAAPPPGQRHAAGQRQVESSPRTTPRIARNNSTPSPARPSPTPSQRNAASVPAQFPTAKAVPGKPGYVFSPFDPNGGYVDVNGYSAGSKVKDPYSGKVFLVP